MEYNSTITFTPNDVANVITIGKLTEYLKNQIIEIRNNEMEYTGLVDSIKKLKQFGKDWDKKKDVASTFAVYEQIKTVSLKIRQLLKTVLPAIEIYDEINYALYYDGKRYVTKKLNPAWLRVSSKGALKLNLNKAVHDIEKQYQDDIVNKIRELFNNHYEAYVNMITGTYRGDPPIGIKGARVTLGHVAEAFEEHLSEHHNNDRAHQVYQILMIDKQQELSSSLLNAATYFEKHQVRLNQWYKHEKIEKGWAHISHSLGTQGGVVAGDVGRMQVKQIKEKGGGELKLASMNILEDGVSIYSEILNKKISPTIVAYKLANYLSESVPKDSADLLTKKVSGTINNDILKELKGLKLDAYVHI